MEYERTDKLTPVVVIVLLCLLLSPLLFYNLHVYENVCLKKVNIIVWDFHIVYTVIGNKAESILKSFRTEEHEDVET